MVSPTSPKVRGSRGGTHRVDPVGSPDTYSGLGHPASALRIHQEIPKDLYMTNDPAMIFGFELKAAGTSFLQYYCVVKSPNGDNASSCLQRGRPDSRRRQTCTSDNRPYRCYPQSQSGWCLRKRSSLVSWPPEDPSRFHTRARVRGNSAYGRSTGEGLQDRG